MSENKEPHVIQPELHDIIEMVKRYFATNKKNVCFILDCIAFDENKIKNHEKDIIKDSSDWVMAFGDKATLRIMLEDLRNMVEDEADKEGFVNI